MKNLHVMAFIVLVTQFAWPEIKSGSVVVVIWSDEIVTVAADSRVVESATGRQDDTQCKIAAFGNYFVLAVTGSAGDNRGWNAYASARDIWKLQARTIKDPTKLVTTLAQKWADEAEPHFRTPEFVADARSRLKDGNVFESALFVAAAPPNGLAITEINFFLDIGKYDKTKEITVWHEPDKNIRTGRMGVGALGYSAML